MRIAIDIDGVVCDFANPCNEWLASHLDAPLAPLDSWHWFENYGEPGKRAWNEFWRYVAENPWWFGTLPMKPGAFNALTKMEEMGHEPFFLTARNPRYRLVTRAWLDDNGLYWPSEHNRDKTEVPFDLLVDDHIENILTALTDPDRDAALWVNPWTEEIFDRDLARTRAFDVADWDDVLNVVEYLDGRLR